jgi:hypothetical protein
LPGGGDEQSAVITNLNTTTTMQAYFADLRLFFQRAGLESGAKIVLHVEPDMWGYVQQVADQEGTRDDARSIPAKVGSTGVPEVAGLPDNVAGLAQGIVRLRDQYAPNVMLGYHVSVWGTNVDIGISDPTDAEVDTLGNRAGAFYNTLGASFDLAFGEFSDRDSAYMILVQGKGPQSWWNSEDFRRHTRFITRFVATSGKRMVLWQIPFGNTKMRALNNTTRHYQDNRVEWLLDEPARTHLTAYINAGAIGFLFGGGNVEVTDARDAAGDGVTDPPAINGNDLLSLSAGDDGGFFHNRAAAYYSAGAMPLPGGSAQPPTATPTPTVPGVPTSTSTPPVTAPGQYSTSASVLPGTVGPGGSTTVTLAVTSGSAATVLVDLEIYNAAGDKVEQQWVSNQAFTAGQQRSFPFTWNVPANTPVGTYTVKIGIFSTNWSSNLAWNDDAGPVVVAAGGQATPTPTPTATLPAVACSPRPPVRVTTAASGGSLQVTLAATGDNNRLLALDFTRTTGALVDVGGRTGRTGAFVVSLPGTSASASFAVRRAGSGAATVRLDVVDRCGRWPTLVGGGPNAF